MRVDLLGSLAGLSFDEAFEQRSQTSWDGVPVNIIAKTDLIVSKRAAGRPQDRLDLKGLEGQKRKR